MIRRSTGIIFLVGITSSLSVAAGKSATSKAPALVWPMPPEQPRITYVQSIAAPADVGIKVSGFRRFSNWLTGAKKGNESLARPFGVALDDAGNLCVTDTSANTVCCFDRDARRWYHWEEIGKTRLSSPVAIAKKGDVVFVADSTLACVLAFDLDGKLRFEIKQNIERPSGLALVNERLLVADAAQHRIAVFDLNGKFISAFGKRGDAPGDFNFPTHVAAGPNGSVLVTESMNRRVQMFDASGVFQRQIGGAGDNPGHFSRPKGVAVDSFGHIFVVDALFDNVQVFDATGRLLMDFGRGGSQPGEFWLPNGIAIGRDNRIYIADSYNHRV
ncbi:MAG: 6-bladed beta-propeller, partial [Verrucomicrobiota bacterium]